MRAEPTAPGDAREHRARRDTRIGVGLAVVLIAGWGGLLATTLSSWRWDTFGAATPIVAIVAIGLQTWLYCGLFIVAHDAMHGSLAPTRPGLGRALGRVALALYAGFALDRLALAHREHHRAPGTVDDPDFDPCGPTRFWPWFGRFVRRYFGWRQWAVLAIASAALVGIAGVAPATLLAFWALPAMLSALQLFRWGTWLPHRHDGAPFPDAHRARSDPRGRLVTLATCFHFGVHHEHHLRPDVPWWRLPAQRRAMRRSMS
jgi:beta-carotene ketolase (CrtW type)